MMAVKKLTVLASIAIIIGLAAVIILKETTFVYTDLWNNSQKFYTLASTVTSATDNLEVTNMYSGTSTRQNAYNALVATPSITSAYSSFVSYYGTAVTQRNWRTLDFNVNGTFTAGSQSN